MINKVELESGYVVIAENDRDKQKTLLGVENWQLMFTTKQSVIEHIELLNKALEFWEYE